MFSLLRSAVPKTKFVANLSTQRFFSSAAFKPSPVTFKKVIREWYQKKDPKTGEFYYEDLFTEDKTTTQPEEYVPWSAKKAESGMMTFLRSDRLKFHSKLPGPGYWFLLVFVLSGLLTYDLYWVPRQEAMKLPPEERRVQEEKNRRMNLVRQKVIDEAKSK